MTDHKPTFHKDSTITYYADSYGWRYRVHPAKVPAKVIESWRAQDRKKWGVAMIEKGFIKRNNVWVPAHEIGNA